jgi:hypothetical protein
MAFSNIHFRSFWKDMSCVLVQSAWFLRAIDQKEVCVSLTPWRIRHSLVRYGAVLSGWFTNRSLFLTTGYFKSYEWRCSREHADARGRRNSLRPSKNYKQASRECRSVPWKQVAEGTREFGNSRTLIGSVLCFADSTIMSLRASDALACDRIFFCYETFCAPTISNVACHPRN